VREIAESEDLATFKDLVNKAISFLDPFIEDKKPTMPITKILAKVMNQIKGDLPYHPRDFYQDGNFPRFVNVAERTVRLIAEQDGHYRAWLAWFMILLHTELTIEFNRFNEKRWFKDHKERYSGISLKDPKTKLFLFYEYLAQHPTKFTIGEKP
jgi:hypothetical protein